MMKILVVGAGALGGYFGGRLLQAGRDVTFLLRPNRIQQLIDSKGLVVKSPYGDFTIAHPPYITCEQIAQPYDLIILSCKAYSLKDCMDAIAPAVGKNTLILPMLNGISHIDALCERFGSMHILGGKVFISATLDDKGHVLHLNKLHTLGFGSLAAGVSDRLLQVLAVLEGAGFDAELSEHILQDMWNKWIFIATVAGMTCLMRASMGDIITSGGAYWVEALFKECSDIANTNGFITKQIIMQDKLQGLLNPNSTLMASMLKDLEKGYIVESEAIIGDFIRKAPIDSENDYPVLRLVYTHLNSYLTRRERNTLVGE